MSKLNLKSTYTRYVGLLKQLGLKEPMETAVGGEFEASGILEHEVLRFYGLSPEHVLIDVGCGSGRLAWALSRTHGSGYLGTDLVVDLLDHAKRRCDRPDWRFEEVEHLAIPAPDGSADMVCFFSVMTHMLHEQSYLYLEEARRVLRPGGRVVFSFLEFANPAHWPHFDNTVADTRDADVHPLNVFLERPAISFFSARLGLPVVDIRDGADSFIPLREPIRFESGREISGLAPFGQSVCVLEKPTG